MNTAHRIYHLFFSRKALFAVSFTADLLSMPYTAEEENNTIGTSLKVFNTFKVPMVAVSYTSSWYLVASRITPVILIGVSGL